MRTLPALLFPLYLLFITILPFPASGPPGSAVIVSHEMGHGSGVHIGRGIILTAAHVIPDGQSVIVTDDKGRDYPADILHIDREHDVAALRIVGVLRSSPLSCRTPLVGEFVSTTGNPGPLKFVTLWGRVSGDVRALSSIQEVIVTDMTTIPGMSGGGLLDQYGRVVGTVSAVMVQPMFGTPLAIGYAVPSSTICALLKTVIHADTSAL